MHSGHAVLSVPRGTEEAVLSFSLGMDVALEGSLGYAEPQFPGLGNGINAWHSVFLGAQQMLLPFPLLSQGSSSIDLGLHCMPFSLPQFLKLKLRGLRKERFSGNSSLGNNSEP